MLLMLARPAAADALTGSVSDDQWDAYWWKNQNKLIPGYLDIKSASVTLDLETGLITMTMDLWGEIPDEPELFNGVQALFWEWAFDVEGGPYPISPWWSTMEEAVVSVIWDGEEWSAQLWDFTVVQVPGDAILIFEALSLDVRDDGFTVVVDSEWMCDIQGGRWAVADIGFKSPPLVFAAYAWWYFDMAGIDMMTGDWTVWPDNV